MLRSCYRGAMRFFKDDCDCLAEVIWYFVDNTDFIQGNAYVSASYDEKTRWDGCPVGEMDQPRQWRNGSVPAGTQTDLQAQGTPEQWYGDISVLTDAVCPPTSIRGRGCGCVRGAGWFHRDRMWGSGCACARGCTVCWAGIGCACCRSTSAARWVGLGCACASGLHAVYQGLGCACASGVQVQIDLPCVCFDADDPASLLLPNPPVPPYWWGLHHPTPTVSDPVYGTLTFTTLSGLTWTVTAPDGGIWTWYGMSDQANPSGYRGFLTFKDPTYGATAGSVLTLWQDSPQYLAAMKMEDPLTRVSGQTVLVHAPAN